MTMKVEVMMKHRSLSELECAFCKSPGKKYHRIDSERDLTWGWLEQVQNQFENNWNGQRGVSAILCRYLFKRTKTMLDGGWSDSEIGSEAEDGEEGGESELQEDEDEEEEDEEEVSPQKKPAAAKD